MEIEAINALHVIEESCACKTGLVINFHICLIRLAHTILAFLGVLLSATIHEDIRSSVAGLIFLYRYQEWTCRIFNCSIDSDELRPFKPDGVDFALNVFSETATGVSRIRDRLSAVSNEDVCVYQNVIQNSEESPTSIANYHITPEYISYAGTAFTEIRLRGNGYDFDPFFDSLSFIRGLSSNMTVEILVEETDDQKFLKLGYRVGYTDKNTDQYRHVWLDFSYILFNYLMPKEPSFKCSGNCQALYSLERFPSACLSWRDSLKTEIIFDPASVNRAQEVLDRPRCNFDTWMLMVQDNRESQSIRLHVIDNHLLLYLIMSVRSGGRGDPKRNLSLCSFT